MPKSELHKLADEKVDYYKRNAEFNQLLLDYYKSPSKEIRDKLWMMAYHCACNIFKKRFGHWWSFDQISELALDVLNVLFTRIENRVKWPDGYPIYSLPTRITQAFLTVYYESNRRASREKEVSWDALVESCGESVYNIMADKADYVDECLEEEDYTNE